MTERDVPTPMAVVGMACRFPGADDLHAFWKLMVEGRSAVADLPAGWFDESLYFHPEQGRRGQTYSRRAALVGRRPFQADRYPRLAPLDIPPETFHLSIVDVAADAWRHAGYDPLHLAARRFGVYLGNTRGNDRYIEQTLAVHADDLFRRTAHSAALAPLLNQHADGLAREAGLRFQRTLPLSHGAPADFGVHWPAAVTALALGAEGPAMVVNAACASSLAAFILAASALAAGEIAAAVVGGTNHIRLDRFLRLSFAQALSADDSRPFDADADGLILAEGHGAVVVKTLDRAQRDGDTILGVVRSWGMSADGRGKSVWAPRKEGQQAALQRAYRPGVDLSRLGFIEAHATSTQLGDATEMSALAEVLHDLLPADQPKPAVGSVKAHIGHPLEAAGVAGLIKTLLVLHHGLIPGQPNVRGLNPKIDWNSAPFYVPLQNTPWPRRPDGLPRLAAVNAFGIGGLNAHLLVEEAPAVSASHAKTPPPAVPRSDRRAAVVGLGCLFPGALSPGAFRDLLRQGVGSFTPGDDSVLSPTLDDAGGLNVRRLDEHRLAGRLAGYVHDWKRHKIPPLRLARANSLQFALLDAVDQALADAGLTADRLDLQRTAVVMGSMTGGDFLDQLQLGMRLPELRRAWIDTLLAHDVPPADAEHLAKLFEDEALKRLPAVYDESGSADISTLVTLITKTYDLMGGGFAVDAGEASGMAAVYAAVRLLDAGVCDLAVCGAGQRALHSGVFERFARLGRLDAGTPPGEGAAVVLLKRYADAVQSGDRILAVVDDTAGYCAPLPADAVAHSPEFSRWPSSVGVRYSDLPDQGLNLAPNRVSTSVVRPSTLIGHTMGGSGMALLTAAAVSLEPPATNGSSSHPAYHGSALASSVAHVGSTDPMGLAFTAVVHHPQAFPPAVSTPVVENKTSIDPVASPSAPDLPWRRWEADTWSALTGRLAAEAPLSTASSFPPFRLTAVLGDDLSERLARAVQTLEARPAGFALPSKGLFAFERPDRRPTAAFCFPSPDQAAPSRDALLAARQTLTGGPTAAGESSTSEVDDSALWRRFTQSAVERLASHGARPTVYLGHGAGMAAAFAAAGVWSWDDAETAVKLLQGDSSGALHTPEFNAARLERWLATVAMGPASAPIVSGVTGRFLSDPDDLRLDLLRQSSQPVDYAQALSRLTPAAASVWVEFAVGGRLTPLHRRSVPRSDAAALSLFSSSGSFQLPTLLAALDAAFALEPWPVFA